MNGKFYVYIYTDPRNGLPFYVGKGSGKRVGQRGAKSRNPFFSAVFNKLKNEGFNPKSEIVFVSDSEEECFGVEEHLIKSYGRRNIEDNGILTNLSLGGQGNVHYNFDDEFFNLLGKVQDQEIADKYGCCRELVCYYRNSRGIPAPLHLKNMSPPPEMGGWNRAYIPEDCIEMLGQASDVDVAKMFNIGRYAISRERKRRKIPAFGKEKFERRYKKSNPDFEKIFTFQHRETGDVFKGNRQQIAEYVDCSYDLFSKLVRGLSKSSYGWEIVMEHENE